MSFAYFFVESERATFLKEIQGYDQNLRFNSKTTMITKKGKNLGQASKAFFAASARFKTLLLLRASIRYLPFLTRFSLFQGVLKNSELSALIVNFRQLQSQTESIELNLDWDNGFFHEEMYGLDVMTSSKPKISLVIPTYNRSDLVFNLLHSISKVIKKSEIEIIVVDDGSEDDQFQRLKKVRGVHVYHLSENVGYTRATNFGASKATGDYILLLNNDTLLLPTTILRLENYLDTNPDVWAVAPKILWQDLSVQEFGSHVDLQGNALNLGVGYGRTHPQINFTREAVYASAACFLIRTKIWNALEGFDETFAPAYYEDTDLCLRIWQAGGKLVMLHSAEVIHIGSQSYGDGTGSALKSEQLIKNKKAFSKKWRDSNLEIPGEDNSRALVGKLSDRRAIVFFDHQIPNPNRDSGQLRSYQLLNTFRDLGFHVIVVSRINVAHFEVVETLRTKGFEIHSSFESFFNCHDRNSKLLSLFWLSKFETANFLINQIKDKFPTTPIVFDTVDVHFLREERKALLDDSASKSKLLGPGFSRRVDVEILKKKELEIMKQATKVIVVSPEEHQLLTKEHNIQNCSILWKYLDPRELERRNTVERQSKNKKIILFVGSFNHLPNIDGIEWFAREVLPSLRDKVGEIFEVHVAGGGLSSEKQDFLESQGIRVLGWVQELAPIYQSADVVIAPIRYGAGLKGKILEAAKYERPIVATNIAMEGFTLTPGEDYIPANSPIEFVEGIKELIENPQNAKSMGSKIRSAMSVMHSKEKFTSELESLLTEVLT